MRKKITLNLDAAIVIILVFIVSFGFNLYQRYQYSQVFQENMDLRWDNQNMKINWDQFKDTKTALEKCQAIQK